MGTRFSLVLGAEADRRQVPLQVGKPFRIGRHRENDLVLPHALVSGHHAEIVWEPAGPVLRDVGSRNGTSLNGARVRIPSALGAGDRIVIGATALTVVVEEISGTSVTLLEDRAESQQVFASIDTGASVIEDSTSRRETFRALERASRNLAVLNEMGGVLLEAKNETDLIGRVLDLVLDLLPAERACVILRKPDGSLDTPAVRSRGPGEGEFNVSRTILDRALDGGISLLTSDAVSDERFRAGHSVILQGIRAAMCAPLRSRRMVLGAIYADTRIQTGAFTPTDLEILTTLGIQGGIAVDNLRLLRENVRAERLAAVGAVVAGLGHDIRNILAALTGGAYMIDRIAEESDDPDLPDAWEIVKESTETITSLVNDMVTFSKERTPERRSVDLGRLIEVVANRFARRAAEHRATVRTEAAPGMNPVSAEAPALDRVLSNLVSNALDALPPEGGTVAIRTRDEGDAAILEVEDDGIGIPESNRERVFDLLFSTKGSKGTGFGLAVSKKIVTEHGGTIEFRPGASRGTLFVVRLPRVAVPRDAGTPGPAERRRPEPSVTR